MPLQYEPSIAKLGHAHLTTPDLEKSLWFFRDLVGLHVTERTEDTVYLRAAQDREHHSLVLQAGTKAKLEYLAWRVSRPEDVGLFHDRLVAQGTEVEVSSGGDDGVGESLWFSMPSGHRTRLYYDVQKPAVAEADRSVLLNSLYRGRHHGADVRRIDHINLWTTRDPLVQQEWLRDSLGFKLREFITGPEGRLGSWMSVTPQVHDVAVLKAGDHETTPARLHHLAYWVNDASDLLRAAEIFVEAGVPIDQGPGKHGLTQGMFLYVRDPGSGHRVEVYTNGYQIFDPDWEPVEWGVDDIALALCQWGPTDYVPHTDDNVMNTTTEA